MALLLVIFIGYFIFKSIQGACETSYLRDSARRNGGSLYCDSNGNLRDTKTGEKLYK